jgi:hypothetical protein
MIARLRTVAILLLLAGLALGVFASRAVRALGTPDLVPAKAAGGDPRIEQKVALYQKAFQLDPQRTERIRRELHLYDRRMTDLLWELRREHADRFDRLYKDADDGIRAVLEEGR